MDLCHSFQLNPEPTGELRAQNRFEDNHQDRDITGMVGMCGLRLRSPRPQEGDTVRIEVLPCGFCDPTEWRSRLKRGVPVSLCISALEPNGERWSGHELISDR